jgi:hypothetical protein
MPKVHLSLTAAEVAMFAVSPCESTALPRGRAPDAGEGEASGGPNFYCER